MELRQVDPSIRLDIRYATPNNFMGRPVYPTARAFLRRDAASALARAHRALRPKGYGLLVFDGYRPWSVTKRFWESATAAQRRFLADPAEGSRHNRGCAVDLTLFDLRTGAEIAMPSAYDEMSERASPRYGGGSEAQRSARETLRCAMEREGFTVDPGEWWHFNAPCWRHAPVLDVPFDALR